MFYPFLRIFCILCLISLCFFLFIFFLEKKPSFNEVSEKKAPFLSEDCIFVSDQNKSKNEKIKSWLFVEVSYEDEVWKIGSLALEDFLKKKIKQVVIFFLKEPHLLFLHSFVDAFKESPPSFRFLIQTNSYRFTESLKKMRPDWFFLSDPVFDTKLNIMSAIYLENFLNLTRDVFILEKKDQLWNYSLRSLNYLVKKNKTIIIKGKLDSFSSFHHQIKGEMFSESAQKFFENSFLVSRCHKH